MSVEPENKIISRDNRLLTRWEAVVAEQGEAPAVWNARTRTIHSFVDLADRAEAIAKKLPESLLGYTVILCMEDGFDWLAAFLALRSRHASLLPVEHRPGARTAWLHNKTTFSSAVLDENGFRWTSKAESPCAAAALFKTTSGTTGGAKALPFGEGELIADGENICRTMGIHRDDRNFALLPLTHSYGLGNLVLPLLTQGVPLCLGSSQLPSAIEEEVAWSGATVFPSVPAVLDLLIRSQVRHLAPLRLVISAAAPLLPEVARNFADRFSLNIHNFYGSSETGGIAYDRTGELALMGVAIGTALDGVSLSVDPGGCLEVKSAAVSYALGEAAGSGCRRFVVADRVEIFDGGCLRLLGRVDRVIKYGGRRYDLDELEASFRKALDSSEVAMIYCAERSRFGLFVPTHYAARAQEALRQEIAHLQPRTKVRELSRLPRTPRGKIDAVQLSRLI